jgi:hypothetical protein
MTRRLLVLTLIGSLGTGSLAFAGESLLQSGVRIGAEVGRASTAPASDSQPAISSSSRLRPEVARERAASFQSQEAPALATSGMRRRTKILLYVAAGVAFAASAYSIDHHVVNVTPSSLGTRKD